MQTQEPIRTETPPPALRPWLIAAAAFVVVIVIGALLVHSGNAASRPENHTQQ